MYIHPYYEYGYRGVGVHIFIIKNCDGFSSHLTYTCVWGSLKNCFHDVRKKSKDTSLLHTRVVHERPFKNIVIIIIINFSFWSTVYDFFRRFFSPNHFYRCETKFEIGADSRSSPFWLGDFKLVPKCNLQNIYVVLTKIAVMMWVSTSHTSRD